MSFIEKIYEINLHNNKQSVEKILIQRAVKTIIQILYDKGLLDGFPNANKVLKDLLFSERLRNDLEETNDVVQ